MNSQDVKVLLDYHYWARDVMFDALAALSPDQFTRPIESSFKSVRDTVGHIYGADWIWYVRWVGQSPTALPTSEKFPDLRSIRSAWSELEEKVRAFVDDLGEDGISRIFEYRLLAGTAGASPFWQMVQHVVNHGSYHRGQVTTMLRQLGAAPPKSMDLITFYRVATSQRPR